MIDIFEKKEGFLEHKKRKKNRLKKLDILITSTVTEISFD